MIPSKVRASIGTAAVLGLRELRLDASPTTAYMMLYTETGCVANCLFCTQARESDSERSQLSRVMWPDFPTEMVLKGFRDPRAAKVPAAKSRESPGKKGVTTKPVSMKTTPDRIP